jgi:hypothetical protein
MFVKQKDPYNFIELAGFLSYVLNDFVLLLFYCADCFSLPFSHIALLRI